MYSEYIMTTIQNQDLVTSDYLLTYDYLTDYIVITET